MRILIAWDFFGVINEVEPSELSLILQKLLDAGSEQIIVSHSPHAEIEQYLESNRLKQYVTLIYGAEWHMADPGLGKAPALSDYITNQGPFDLMLMIGDSLSDMADARTARMQAILFDVYGHYATVGPEVDCRIADPAEIVELVHKASAGKLSKSR